MAIRHQLIKHAPSALWSVLERPDLYGEWVVGTSGSRSAQGHWPEVGSSIEYTVRIGPKEFHGRTVVRRLERPRILELEAHSGLLGSARIAFDIRPWGDETLVRLDEHPLRAPAAPCTTRRPTCFSSSVTGPCWGASPPRSTSWRATAEGARRGRHRPDALPE